MDRAELQIVLTEAPNPTGGPQPSPSASNNTFTLNQPKFNPAMLAIQQRAVEMEYESMFGKKQPERTTPKEPPDQLAGVSNAAVSTLTGPGASAFGMLGSVAAQTAKALGPLGVGALALTGGFVLLKRSIDSLVDRYAQYSPAIATAQAFAEVRQIFGDMRRANQLGTSFSRYIEVQSRLDQSFQDLKANVIESLTPTLIDLMTGLNVIIDSLNKFSIDNIVKAVVDSLTGQRPLVPDIRRELRQIIANQQSQMDIVVGTSAEPRQIAVPEI